jgi:hypothetical protein
VRLGAAVRASFALPDLASALFDSAMLLVRHSVSSKHEGWRGSLLETGSDASASVRESFAGEFRRARMRGASGHPNQLSY